MNQPPSRWSFLFLPILFCYAAGLSYYIFMLNPDLMHHESRISRLVKVEGHQLQPIPKPSTNNKGKKSAAEATLNPSNDFSHKGVLSPDLRASYRYQRLNLLPFADFKDIDESLWMMDQDSAIFSANKGRLLGSFDLEGQLRWKFQLSDNQITTPPVLTDSIIFLATEKGKIYALDKASGQLRWMLPGLGTLSGLATVHGHVFVTEATDGGKFRLVKVAAHSGELIWRSKEFEGSVSAPLSWYEPASLLIAGTDKGIVYGLSAVDGKKKWSHSTTGAIQSPATVVDSNIYVANSEGQAVAFRGESGEKIWEYQLSSGSKGSFTHVPSHDLMAILTDSGYLHAINRKTGSGEWRFNTHNSSYSQALSAIRLDGEAVYKLELSWRHQGWVLWSPCGEEKLCIYNPSKGQLLARIPTLGNILGRPVFKNGDFFLGLRKAKTDDKQTGRVELALARFDKNAKGKGNTTEQAVIKAEEE